MQLNSIREAVDYLFRNDGPILPFTTDEICGKLIALGFVYYNKGYVASLIKAHGYVFDKSVLRWYPKTKAERKTYISSKDAIDELAFAKDEVTKLKGELLAAKKEAVIYREMAEDKSKTIISLEKQLEEYRQQNWQKTKKLSELQFDEEKLKHYFDKCEELGNNLRKFEDSSAEILTSIVHDEYCRSCAKRIICSKYNDSPLPKFYNICDEHRALLEEIRKLGSIGEKDEQQSI